MRLKTESERIAECTDLVRYTGRHREMGWWRGSVGYTRIGVYIDLADVLVMCNGNIGEA